MPYSWAKNCYSGAILKRIAMMELIQDEAAMQRASGTRISAEFEKAMSYLESEIAGEPSLMMPGIIISFSFIE
jgi:hypothetical protein